jgi:hypothetical protein
VSIAVGGSEGSNDPVLCPELQFRQVGVSVQLNVTEEGKVVVLVSSLLLCGGDGDGINLSKLHSQVSSCESNAGRSRQMLMSGGTWLGREDTSRWVRVVSGR